MNNATISLTIFHITRQGEICRFVGNKLWFCSSIKTLIENIALFSLRPPCRRRQRVLHCSLNKLISQAKNLLFSLRPPCRRRQRVLHCSLNKLISQAKNLLFSLRPPCRRRQRVLHCSLNKLISQAKNLLFSLKNPCKLLKSLQIFTPPPPLHRVISESPLSPVIPAKAGIPSLCENNSSFSVLSLDWTLAGLYQGLSWAYFCSVSKRTLSSLYSYFTCFIAIPPPLCGHGCSNRHFLQHFVIRQRLFVKAYCPWWL